MAFASYIDPRVEPATRTAKERVEVPSREGTLRLGMFVQMSFRGASGERGALGRSYHAGRWRKW